jgi:hypothetical protein
VKTAVLFSIPLTRSEGVCWRWRSADGNTDSAGAFASYNECRDDALGNGYAIAPAPAQIKAVRPRRARSTADFGSQLWQPPSARHNRNPH